MDPFQLYTDWPSHLSQPIERATNWKSNQSFKQPIERATDSPRNPVLVKNNAVKCVVALLPACPEGRRYNSFVDKKDKPDSIAIMYSTAAPPPGKTLGRLYYNDIYCSTAVMLGATLKQTRMKYHICSISSLLQPQIKWLEYSLRYLSTLLSTLLR
jgi:hypothetical protein